MTEGGMGMEGGEMREDVNGVNTRGFISEKKIIFAPKALLSSHMSAVFFYFSKYANQRAVGSVCYCDAQRSVV